MSKPEHIVKVSLPKTCIECDHMKGVCLPKTCIECVLLKWMYRMEEYECSKYDFTEGESFFLEHICKDFEVEK